jgi:hypothetical protein
MAQFIQLVKNLDKKLELHYKGLEGGEITMEDDGMMTGEILNIGDDLIIFHGKNKKDLEDDFKRQIDLYLKNKK